MIIRHESARTGPSEGEAFRSRAVSGIRRAHFQPLFASITLAILASSLLLPSLCYPLARDQGVFAYVGAVILRGGWPYRDVWELKPPGIYYLYAAIVAGFGHSITAVRAIDLLAAIATTLLLRAVLLRFVTREAAWLGALLYSALYLRLGYWGMAQAESYANLCIAAALLLWLRASGVQAFRRSAGTRLRVQAFRRSGVEDGSPSLPLHPYAPHPWSLAAGLASGAALLLKVTALPCLAAALGVVSLLRLGREGGRAEAWRVVLLLTGLLAPVALVAAVMAWTGAGAAYLEIQRGFVTGYVALPAPGAAAAGWRYCWHLYALPALLAALGLMMATNPARLLFGAWLAAAVLSVAMQRKYFGYHWTSVLLPLAGVAGLALARLLDLLVRTFTAEITSRLGPPGSRGNTARGVGAQPIVLRRGKNWLLNLLGAALIAGWSVARPANGYVDAARLLTGRLRQDRYWERFGRPYHGDFSFLADVWAADYIRSHTRPTDPVYIWGFEPLTLFLANRYAPSRFVFAVPLVSPWTPQRWREELMRELRARPPVLFGVMRHDAIPHASGRRDDSAAQLKQFPALRAFLHRNYRYETTIEDLTLFRRRTG